MVASSAAWGESEIGRQKNTATTDVWRCPPAKVKASSQRCIYRRPLSDANLKIAAKNSLPLPSNLGSLAVEVR